jgi:hypothetical protein
MSGAPTSMIKYLGQVNGGKQKLHWGRVDLDGLPFRGAVPPTWRNEDFENRSARVGDARNSIFDLTDADQNARYLEVLDRIVNGWYQCLNRVFIQEKMVVYIEWVEWHLENGMPMHSQVPMIGMEAGT